MTLSQIMTLALRQLGEEESDLAEYEDSFRIYANIGYGIAVKEFLSPKEWFSLRTDESGLAPVPDERVVRVVQILDGETGAQLAHRLTLDGQHIALRERERDVGALCEVSHPLLKAADDVPLLPEGVHHALADYICFRHLSCGSLAKQRRAEFFRESFYAAMRRLRPQGMGATTDYRNLYMVTDVRYAR